MRNQAVPSACGVSRVPEDNVKTVEMKHMSLKPTSFQIALAIGAFASFFIATAEAQRYNGRCGQPPREPNCVSKRNPSDRQVRKCQDALKDFGRKVESHSRCLDSESRGVEREFEKVQLELQALRNRQYEMSTAVHDAQEKLSCNASGKNFC